MIATDPRSLPELVSGLAANFADLVRKESELVLAELGEKLADAKRAGASMAVGAALLLGGFLVLLEAIVLALAKAMDPLWASIVVGVVAAIAGFVFVRAGAKGVQPTALTPDRSARQLRKDVHLAKTMTPGGALR